MTTSNLSLHKSLSTNDIQANYPAQYPQKHPMNGHCKKNGKMEAIYEETEDETMEETSHNSTSTGPMQSSMRLAAKLKKLKETKMILDFCMEAMEIDAKNRRNGLKQSHWQDPLPTERRKIIKWQHWKSRSFGMMKPHQGILIKD